MIGMSRTIYIVLVIGILVALFPIIGGAIDNYISQRASSAPSTQPEEGANVSSSIIILQPYKYSSEGDDTLYVYPGELIAEKNTVFDLRINVYFRHTQPCDYPDWKVYYTIDGGLQVVDETNGTLVDSKTYEQIITLKAIDNGTVTVVFQYGSNCPFGDEEVVTINVYVTDDITKLNVTTPVYNETTMTEPVIEEEKPAETVNGTIEAIDTARDTIVVDGYLIYLKGEWVYDNQILDAYQVIELLSIGEKVSVEYEVTGSGKLHALKIITEKGEVFTKTEG